eukprot:COSAG01_NODE_18452_length_1075_cov_0.925205_2_plen_60_part_00
MCVCLPAGRPAVVGGCRTGYTLERCGPDGEWAAVAEGLDATEFVDEGLRPLTTTRYRVG